MNSPTPTAQTWSQILAVAYALFDDLETKGFGIPPFSLGGGTVLMFRFQHRLSKDIDFFGYDAQWLPLLSPRLNETAAAVASSWTEQANGVKIVMPQGDIDFVIAADVAIPVVREKVKLEGREILMDPTSEILAKKLFYRAAAFKARDVYDFSAAIDLDPSAARTAVRSAASKGDLLVRRLDDLAELAPETLLEGLVPYAGELRFASDMVSKVRAFAREHTIVTRGARGARTRDESGKE
jgi:hypothetical protein